MTDLETLQSRAEIHEQSVVALHAKVRALPEATKIDLKPRVERVETMAVALRRDVDEVNRDTGADFATATELNATLEKELSSLIKEVETVSQGNPTTFDFVGDKLMNGIAGAAGKVKDTFSSSDDTK